MPELRDDSAAFAMDRVGHEPPTLDLRPVPQAGRARPAMTFAADPGRLRNDQARARALRIIEGHQFVRDCIAAGARAGERVHDNAVWKLKRTDTQRIEQARHVNPSLCYGDVPQ